MIERTLYFALGALLFAVPYALVAMRLGPVFDQWLRRRYARRLHARLERGSDRYFEELRSIRAAALPAYVAHGFIWHFVRAFAFMMLLFALDLLTDFASVLTLASGGAA